MNQVLPKAWMTPIAVLAIMASACSATTDPKAGNQPVEHLEPGAASGVITPDTVVIPALEAFEPRPLPTSSGPTGGIRFDRIELDGRSVAYASAGTGKLTVVFEAGLGNGMDSWALVAPDLAVHARVFAYDRPGYGNSDLTDAPRDAHTMVDELRRLLFETGHEPPYVLVGHSLGGTLMDYFARTYPDEVAGLVLVDSRHHDFTARCVAHFGPVDCDIPTEADVEQAPRPIREEWQALATTEQQLSDAAALVEMPLVVIVAGIAEGTPGYADLWRETQHDYADQSPGSRLIVAEDSDHAIPAQQPDLIIDAITHLIGASR